MRATTQRGAVQQVFAVLIGLSLIMAIAVYWTSQKNAAKRAEAVRIAAAAQAAKEAEETRAQEERKALAQKLEQAKDNDILRTALKSFDVIHTRWVDARRIAEVTSRMSLSGPLANLQAVRRDADALVAPNCLTLGKAKMLEAMQLEIDGFVAFLGDANIGKYVLKANVDTAADLFKTYQSERAQCPAV